MLGVVIVVVAVAVVVVAVAVFINDVVFPLLPLISLSLFLVLLVRIIRRRIIILSSSVFRARIGKSHRQRRRRTNQSYSIRRIYR